MEINKNIKCSNCGFETVVRMGSGLELKELHIAGKCPHCGNSLQLSYDIIKQEEPQQAYEPVEPAQENIGIMDLEKSLFDLPSDTIKDIMED